MLLSETREVSLAWEQGTDGMVAYFGNAWNWVDWVNLGLPLAKFLSDAAARLLGFQMLPTRWAHALWGFMTVTLALRFFRYASCSRSSSSSSTRCSARRAASATSSPPPPRSSPSSRSRAT